jgi:hypothetical protein
MAGSPHYVGLHGDRFLTPSASKVPSNPRRGGNNQDPQNETPPKDREGVILETSTKKVLTPYECAKSVVEYIMYHKEELLRNKRNDDGVLKISWGLMRDWVCKKCGICVGGMKVFGFYLTMLYTYMTYELEKLGYFVMKTKPRGKYSIFYIVPKEEVDKINLRDDLINLTMKYRSTE